MYNYKISIIIPVYNTEKYLDYCLKSIVNQSMSINDIQVIIVNNCSDDGSLDIINKYVVKYSSFMLVNLKNHISEGPGKPRDIGMNYVEGEYVLFVDSDDMIDADYCEILYNKIKFEQTNVICCNYKPFYEVGFDFKNEKPVVPCVTKPLLNPYVDIPFTPWGKIFKFSFLKEYDINFVQSNWEDILFFAKVCYYSQEITFLSNYYGYFYNKIDWGSTYSSSSNSLSLKGLLSRVETFRILINFANDNNSDVLINLLKFCFEWHYFQLINNNSFSDGELSKYVNVLCDLIDILKVDLNFEFPFSLINFLVKHKKIWGIKIARLYKSKF